MSEGISTHAVRLIGVARVEADVHYNLKVKVNAHDEAEAIKKAEDTDQLDIHITERLCNDPRIEMDIDISTINTEVIKLGEDEYMRQIGAPRLL